MYCQSDVEGRTVAQLRIRQAQEEVDIHCESKKLDPLLFETKTKILSDFNNSK